jgi:hypothetical protein
MEAQADTSLLRVTGSSAVWGVLRQAAIRTGVKRRMMYLTVRYFLSSGKTSGVITTIADLLSFLCKVAYRISLKTR